jgi:hypothetical protein
MDNAGKFLDITEKLLLHVERQQEVIKKMQSELNAHSAALCEMLEWLRHPEEGSASPEEEEAAQPILLSSPTLALVEGAERRGLPRRKGNPVSVLLSNSNGQPFNFQGVVVDRSPDGLCLVVDHPVDVGTLLRVRPVHDLIGADWFPIEVRSCRPELKIWILGCRFAQRLSWSNLRLFG